MALLNRIAFCGVYYSIVLYGPKGNIMLILRTPVVWSLAGFKLRLNGNPVMEKWKSDHKQQLLHKGLASHDAAKSNQTPKP